MEKISAQKNIIPNRTRPMIATVPTTSTDIMYSEANVSFLMAAESLVLFKTNSFLLLSIDSSRV